ncbi:MAG: tetratricopeptide repeat protein [Candidatus Sulfotelmatobacter sp.]
MFRNLSLVVLILSALVALAQETSASFSDIVANATAARDVNDIPRAVELYRQALKVNPQWADGWWFMGSLEYGAGEYPIAIDALSHYIDLTPNAAPALAIRGLSEFETGDYQKSLNDIQHALSLGAANQSRNEKILRFHESMLLTRLGRFEDAVRSYGFFAPEEPNPELLLAVGLAGLRAPLFPKDVSPDQQETYRSAGKAALDYMKGDRESSRAEFQKLFQRTPPIANAHYLYGFLLYSSEPEEAMVEFKHELEVSPKNSAAQVMLAWIPLLRNDGSEALPYAQKAAAEDPSSPSAQLVLGRALTETDNAKDGVEHLEKTEQMQPDNIEVHIALAKAYSKLGRKEDARRERLLCLEMNKNETAAIHP